MNYEVSPSTLRAGLVQPFGCPRCFWLKVQKGLRLPENGLGHLHTDIHKWIYQYIEHSHIPGLPSGRILHTELKVKGQPIANISPWGYADAIIHGDEFTLIDIKTTKNHNYAKANYALQICVYAYCLKYPAEGYPAIPLNKMGLLCWYGHRFGVNEKTQEAGIVGNLSWVPVPYQEEPVIQFYTKASQILASEYPPPKNEDCSTCACYESAYQVLKEYV